VASADIATGDLVLRIPWNAMIAHDAYLEKETPDVVRKQLGAFDLDSTRVCSSRERLALKHFVARHTRPEFASMSPFAPYFASLPPLRATAWSGMPLF